MDAQRLLFCALCFFIGVQSHCQLKIGGDPNRLNQRFLGVNIQYGWSPNFANDRPVESLDYEID